MNNSNAPTDILRVRVKRPERRQIRFPEASFDQFHEECEAPASPDANIARQRAAAQRATTSAG